MSRRFLWSAALPLAAVAIYLAAGPARSVRAQEDPLPAVEMAAGIRVVLGLGDAEPTDWSGSVEDNVRALVGGRRESRSWKLESKSSPLKLAGGGKAPRVLPASLLFVSRAFPETLRARTAQGEFSFDPDDVRLGVDMERLDGRVRLERRAPAVRIGRTGVEEDFVAAAAGADGALWLAYTVYESGRALDAAAALDGSFDSVEFDGNGDRVMLAKRTGGSWVSVGQASSGLGDVWQPAISVTEKGIRVVWCEQRNGNWDLFSRIYDPEAQAFQAERRLTRDPGADINVAVAGEYMAWQARRGDDFDIFAAKIGEAPLRVSTSGANDWRPAIAVDSTGAAWIAWDTYDAGDYDVFLRKLDGGQLGKPIAVAASPRFEARASVAVDDRDRVWTAFEDAGPGWGKDYGDRWPGRRAVPFYAERNILVRVWDGRLRATASRFRAPTVDYFSDDPRIATAQRHKIGIPVMQIDARGRPWLFYRKHPSQTGVGEVWSSYAAYYEGERWSSPIALPASRHLLDRRPSVVPREDGSLHAVYSSDKRQSAVRNREDSDIFHATLALPDPPEPAVLKEIDAQEPRTAPRPVHPNEAADIARMRAARIEVGGKQLQYLRGEFHRHTEFSAHRDWDGPFEEVWRYALDVADMDWIGPGDHDFAVGQDYLWWLQQKITDMYHLPGKFNGMYSYERSARYPSGHRNVIFPRRGIRPLPRSNDKEYNEGTEQDGSADIENLYAYLKRFGAICSSHTSATNMGTDWRDNDPEVEPVVEIFQGHRQNYEETNAPLAARGPDDTIQGYRPKGFVWEAFKKGRRLGFQASSDHISTHISYAVVIAEENSRKGILDAFKKRRSYAANDNILLDVRSGDFMMGDEFLSTEAPRLEIRATGTTPIDRVDIVRQVGAATPEYVASFEPRKQTVDIDWSDPVAVAGQVNMYYVRLRQRNEALAWASPLWIEYKP